MAVQIHELGDGGSNIPVAMPIGVTGGNGMMPQGTSLNDILGFAVIASIFPNIFGRNGGNFNDGNGHCHHVDQDLAIAAVTSQGEATRTAVQTLASSLGQDFNLVYGVVSNLSNQLGQISNAQGMNVMQLINAVQSGNTALGNQISKCCCDNQLAMCQQTNALQQSLNQGFNGVQMGQFGLQKSISDKAYQDQMAHFQQTNDLKDTMNRNYVALDNKIDALESQRKDRVIAEQQAEIATLKSQQYTAGIVQQAVAPVLGQLGAIAAEVEAIKRCQPPTVTLPNNQYTAVPTILANAGADFWASVLANRFTNANPAQTPTTPTSGTQAVVR